MDNKCTNCNHSDYLHKYRIRACLREYVAYRNDSILLLHTNRACEHWQKKP